TSEPKNQWQQKTPRGAVDGRGQEKRRRWKRRARVQTKRRDQSMEEAKRRAVDGRRTMSCCFDGREELESRRREETRRRRRIETKRRVVTDQKKFALAATVFCYKIGGAASLFLLQFWEKYQLKPKQYHGSSEVFFSPTVALAIFRWRRDPVKKAWFPNSDGEEASEGHVVDRHGDRWRAQIRAETIIRWCAGVFLVQPSSEEVWVYRRKEDEPTKKLVFLEIKDFDVITGEEEGCDAGGNKGSGGKRKLAIEAERIGEEKPPELKAFPVGRERWRAQGNGGELAGV
ncbi:hypothetical protein U1Q18_029567, partial [Sarracenia purpurea var. burkii]